MALLSRDQRVKSQMTERQPNPNLRQMSHKVRINLYLHSRVSEVNQNLYRQSVKVYLPPSLISLAKPYFIGWGKGSLIDDFPNPNNEFGD